MRTLAVLLLVACAPHPSDDARGRDTDPRDASDPAADSEPADGAVSYLVDPPPLELGGCGIFPPDTVFHADVRGLPVHPRSEAWLDRLGRERPLKAPAALDRTNPWAPVRYGVPITLADAETPRERVLFDGTYPVERQHRGDYPIPPGLDVQTGFDLQTVIVATDECASYELIGYSDYLLPAANGGARWDLSTRDHGHAVTAARLPLLGTLLRAEEVRRGRVDHVLAFVIPDVARDVDGPAGDPLWPAIRSDGTGDGDDAVPMGAWLRLRSDFDTAALPPAVRVVAEGLKVHGMILGDTGGTAGAVHVKVEKTDAWVGPDDEPADKLLAGLGAWLVVGDFEVVDATPMRSEAGTLAIR